MLNRLCERWKHLSAVRESPSFDADNAESQEVIDDVVCRHLAREYLDVVKAVLTSGDGSGEQKKREKSQGPVSVSIFRTARVKKE